VLRNDDLDSARCRKEFVDAMYEDMRWVGLRWQEGPDCGGPYAPYNQSERLEYYRNVFHRLKAGGFLYPCTCSRQDIRRAISAPHPEDDEPIYPGTCRTERKSGSEVSRGGPAGQTNWRFRIPDGEAIQFTDRSLGPQTFVAGKDFGDFVVWRHDELPSYQLATTADEEAMRITEVVRGADLLRSTARQLLLFRALGWRVPDFFHCPLMKDSTGVRLAKRHDALSLRRLRANGASPAAIVGGWDPADLDKKAGAE